MDILNIIAQDSNFRKKANFVLSQFGNIVNLICSLFYMKHQDFVIIYLFNNINQNKNNSIDYMDRINFIETNKI